MTAAPPPLGAAPGGSGATPRWAGTPPPHAAPATAAHDAPRIAASAGRQPTRAPSRAIRTEAEPAAHVTRLRGGWPLANPTPPGPARPRTARGRPPRQTAAECSANPVSAPGHDVGVRRWSPRAPA